jgi:hypothetical protein
MVVDHFNVLFLEHRLNVFWEIGRIAFPLFAFAVATNLCLRENWVRYVLTLLVVGICSQPIFTFFLGEKYLNVLFTLAGGVAVSRLLRSGGAWLLHLTFAAGALAVFVPFLDLRPFLDFGIPGVLLPVALLKCLQRGFEYAHWALLFLLGLNWYNPHPLEYSPIIAASIALSGGLLAVVLALLFARYPRFLPRYFLHIFYPAHIMILSIVHRFVGQ